MKKETTKLQDALAKIFSDLRCLKWYFLSLSMPLKCKNYLGKYDTDKFPGRINFKQLKRDRREKVKQSFRPGVAAVGWSGWKKIFPLKFKNCWIFSKIFSSRLSGPQVIKLHQ